MAVLFWFMGVWFSVAWALDEHAASRSNAPWSRVQWALVTMSLIAASCAALAWLLRRQVLNQTSRLRESEARYRQLVELSPDATFIQCEGRVVFINQAGLRLLGAAKSDEVVGRPVLDFIHPDFKETVKRRITALRDRQTPAPSLAEKYLRLDGSAVDVEVVAAPFQIGDKPAAQVLVRDISERKQSEEKLHLQTSALEAAANGVAITDRDGHIVWTNPAFTRLTGYSAAEVLGKTPALLKSGAHGREFYQALWQTILSGKVWHGEMINRRRNASIYCEEMTITPLAGPDGGIRHFVAVKQDVTERKEAEAALAYERDMLRTLLDSSPDLIYFKDRQSRFVRFSRAFCEHFHVGDPAQLKGKSDFDFFAESHARPAYEDEQTIIRTAQPIIGKLEEETHADGRVTWCLTSKLPWRDKGGNIIGTFGISKDMTALKKAEAELDAAHRRLVEASRLAGMAEVATDVLHNVGNVLTSVNVSCSLAIDRLKATQVDRLAKVAALLEQNRGCLGEFLTNDARGQQIPGYLVTLAEYFSGEQAAALRELEQLIKHIDHIKQIVAMQQDYAKVAGVVEKVNLTQLVDDALQINGAALMRHTVQIRREFAETPPVITDSHKVLQILINLIRNAKYALDDLARTDPRLLTLRVGNDGEGRVKVQVVDNGIGIPPENLTRIFAHGFTTRTNGHGFGLHSSALAARELGGSLMAQSAGRGQGATFTLLLPVQPPRHAV